MTPLAYQWDGEGMKVLSRHHVQADRQFTIGEVYTMAPVEQRSEASHRQEFAWLREAWLSLPDALAADYPSPEHLRKRALISTGYCNTTDYICSSNAEALRWSTNLSKEVDEYAVVIVSQTVVRVHKAKSQSRRAMPKDEFQASKTAIIDWVANLLGVEPDNLARQQAGA